MKTANTPPKTPTCSPPREGATYAAAPPPPKPRSIPFAEHKGPVYVKDGPPCGEALGEDFYPNLREMMCSYIGCGTKLPPDAEIIACVETTVPAPDAGDVFAHALESAELPPELLEQLSEERSVELQALLGSWFAGCGVKSWVRTQDTIALSPELRAVVAASVDDAMLDRFFPPVVESPVRA